MVVKRYTLSMEKELMLARFPVPKKAMLRKSIKKVAVLKSPNAKDRGFWVLEVRVAPTTS